MLISIDTNLYVIVFALLVFNLTRVSHFEVVLVELGRSIQISLLNHALTHDPLHRVDQSGI